MAGCISILILLLAFIISVVQLGKASGIKSDKERKIAIDEVWNDVVIVIIIAFVVIIIVIVTFLGG